MGRFILETKDQYVLATGQGGTYAYDAARKLISWRTGPFAEAGWVGVYMTAEPGGKGHPATIVLKQKSDARMPGQEGDNEFIYSTFRGRPRH